MSKFSSAGLASTGGIDYEILFPAMLLALGPCEIDLLDITEPSWQDRALVWLRAVFEAQGHGITTKAVYQILLHYQLWESMER